MAKTKVFVVGLGGIAQIAHLPVLSVMQDLEIAGVCDIDKSKAKNVGQKYGVKNIYSNIDKMLEEVEADCMIVTATTSAHKELAVKGLTKGLHVLVEKPLARNFAEGSAIVEVAKKNKKKLMVGMNSRFRPDFMMQESFISAKELGDVFYVKSGFLKKRSTRESWALDKKESGGGVFIDLGIVILDISLWLMKFPEIKSVSAVNYYHSFKTVEDSSFVMLKFKNEATLVLEASWTLHREDDLFYCNVYGTQGSSAINPLKIYKRMHGTLVNVTPLKMEHPSNIFKRSYEYEIQHFISAVRNNTEVISTGEEALARLNIVDAIYKSAKLEKEIIFK